MDAPNVIIGSNSKFARKAQQPDPTPKARTKRSKFVDVYIDDENVLKVSFVMLVRFSTTAAKTFPKPKPSGPSSNTVDKRELRLWSQSPNGRLTAEALRFAVQWMCGAKDVVGPGSLLPPYVQEPQNEPLPLLIDRYAMAVSLDLRPFPFAVQNAICARLSRPPPTYGEINDIRSHISVEDRVTTSMITSFLRTRASPKWYTKAQRQEIQTFFHETPALRELYNKIEQEYEASRALYRHEKGLASGHERVCTASTAAKGPNNAEEKVTKVVVNVLKRSASAGLDGTEPAKTIGLGKSNSGDSAQSATIVVKAKGTGRRRRGKGLICNRDGHRLGMSPNGTLVPGAVYV